MKRLFIIAAGIGLVYGTQAQVVVSSLGQALDMAAAHNRDVQSSALRTGIEEQNQRSSRAPLMPQVKALSTLDYNFALPTQLVPAQFFGGQPGEFLPVQFGTQYNLSAGFEASMPLVNTSAWAETGISKLNTEISRLNEKTILHEVQKNTAKAYYVTLVSQKAVALSALNLKVSDSVYGNARLKFSAGLIEQLEVNRLQNNYLQVKNLYEQNLLVFQRNLLQLQMLLGLNEGETLLLSDSVATAQTETISVTRKTEDFPSVKAKLLATEQAAKYLTKDRLRYVPEVSLYARYMAQAQRNSFNFFDSQQSWYNIGVAGIRFDWPLFTGLARNAAVKRSEARQKISLLELENEKQKVNSENTETNLQVKTSTSNYVNNKNALELAAQNMQIALDKYKEGVYNIDQYLNVYNEAINMQNTYLRSLSDYLIWQSIVQLKNNL